MATSYPTASQARSIASGNKTGKELLQQLMPVGAKLNFAAGTTGTVVQSVAKKVVAVTSNGAPASNGFTIGTDNKLTYIGKGTRLVRVMGLFNVDVGTGTCTVNLEIWENGVLAKAFGTQSVTAASKKLFEVNTLIEMSEGDYIELYAKNGSSTAAVTVDAFTDRAATVPEHGFLSVLA